jgi:hypothetical protein
VKGFLGIVAGSLLLFVVGAMIEEKETFTRDWFASPTPGSGSSEERRAAADAVFLFRNLSSHLYASRGDARFAQRLPASQPIVDEMRAEIEYIRRNGRVETPRLVRIEFLTSEVTEGVRAEVTTREFWVTQHHWPGGGESDPPRSDITHSRYRLGRDGGRWVVTSWDPIAAPEVTP